LKDRAVQVAADALTANPDVNIIFGINDDSALGGLQAFESQGGDTSQLLVVGFGCPTQHNPDASIVRLRFTPDEGWKVAA
jgi:ABC-type sugar transport system substrate-binding protein